jgi:hypothetical protein
MSTWSYSEYIYIIWSKCVCESFFYLSQLLTELLEDKQIAKLGGSWYVQNVSTFLNTFAIVSPLIYVFWIQLTRTHAVFSRIAPVSCFYAEIRLSGKIPENIAKILFCQKTHRARRRDEGGQWPGLTTRGRDPGLVAPTCGEATSVVASTPPSTYIYPLTWKERGFGVFPYRLPLHRHHQKLRFGTRNSVLAPCRDGDSEEIFITIITDISPSAIHDSPIHVWVIPAVGGGDGRDWMRSFM